MKGRGLQEKPEASVSRAMKVVQGVLDTLILALR